MRKRYVKKPPKKHNTTQNTRVLRCASCPELRASGLMINQEVYQHIYASFNHTYGENHILKFNMLLLWSSTQ